MRKFMIFLSILTLCAVPQAAYAENVNTTKDGIELEPLGHNLFAWSMPRETDKGYGQAYIFDFTKNEYPAGEANIRVRGIYNGRGEYMNLYYRDGENTGEF